MTCDQRGGLWIWLVARS